MIGGCFDPEFALWSKGLVRDIRAGTFVAVVSELVAAEVADAPGPVQELYAELLRLGAEELTLQVPALELADLYQRRGILSERFYDDGVHIGLATVAAVDLLVSWNFRHIVHFEKIRMFNAVNVEMGYKALEIRSPREAMRYEEQGDQGSGDGAPDSGGAVRGDQGEEPRGEGGLLPEEGGSAASEA